MNAKSWKTTLGGALLALGPILKNHGTEGWMYWSGEVAMIVGALVLGTAAKDKDVTGVGDSAARPSGWKKNASGK